MVVYQHYGRDITKAQVADLFRALVLGYRGLLTGWRIFRMSKLPNGFALNEGGF